MFRRLFFFSIITLLILNITGGKIFSEPVTNASDKAIQANRPLLMAHYMPWYQTPSVSGYWGWHWTMNHFDPENMDENGQRDIASQYYPLTSPYDSQDEDVLEYQVLLMTLSGIDGVIVDWYGIEDFWDYAVLNESTQKLFSYIKKAGLKFSICYEDQTIKHMVENDHLSVDQAMPHGKQVMQYMQENWFKDEAYLKIGERPVLLNFGPQYFKASSNWESLFSVLETSPLFFTLDHRIQPAATGAFPWPPMWATVDGVLSADRLEEYLDDFYQKAQTWEVLIGSAFPGFHDIYEQAGLGYTHGYLDANQGAIFESTLRTAIDNNSDIIQLVTWNDYGEGTIIEPTVEFEYRYLEMVQNIRSEIDSAFSFDKSKLRLPQRILELRRKYENNAGLNEQLDKVFKDILDNNTKKAKGILDSLSANMRTEKGNNISEDYSLLGNYPNPFNSSTNIHYRVPKSSQIKLSVFNSTGQRISTLVDEHVSSGHHTIEWDAQKFGSGVYLIRLTGTEFTAVHKCLLIK